MSWVAPHNGVRVDNDVDPSSNLFTSLLLNKAGVKLSRSGKNYGWGYDTTSE